MNSLSVFTGGLLFCAIIQLSRQFDTAPVASCNCFITSEDGKFCRATHIFVASWERRFRHDETAEHFYSYQETGHSKGNLNSSENFDGNVLKVTDVIKSLNGEIRIGNRVKIISPLSPCGLRLMNRKEQTFLVGVRRPLYNGVFVATTCDIKMNNDYKTNGLTPSQRFHSYARNPRICD